jgi:hypothetical protein
MLRYWEIFLLGIVTFLLCGLLTLLNLLSNMIEA